MAQALSVAPQAVRLSPARDHFSPSPRPSRSSLSASVSPPPQRPHVRHAPHSTTGPRSSSRSKNEYEMTLSQRSTKPNGKLPLSEEPKRYHRETSVDSDSFSLDGNGSIRRKIISGARSGSVRSSKSPYAHSEDGSVYNGLPTLETVQDDPDIPVEGTSKPPPPAPSAATGHGDRPLTRKRRSSSIKRKPSPGVTPKNVVDWEIPRKTLHSSIGFLTLLLNHLNPPTLRPLLTVLTTILVGVSTADILRFRYPAFAELWELTVGFLMRESERQKVNGVIWYLAGVIFVLALYPRDVAVVSILTLSWSDTTASTIGRLWGRYTPPLPAHFPGLKLLPFAPRKSLAGFLAATITGVFICLGFWAKGSGGKWAVLESVMGLFATAGVVGVGGAVVEALDLGLDDNLTLPILSGAITWVWLIATNVLLS
ncbi:hypothetical protein TREMEDRAFT_73615 [Tremella mesenterica DSM 1558]|uniref:uncharacterized protein n=1 Tax=Tremella mesenterica (strain ATCC 24925 / CBS 8224 / DSM 1558 / NBRC 9311 / NRRL Y-6157 / RJB 2259-6 / UBC 559-6) TaxID=578456 RepID=UPI0003F4A1BE|nr:uncharacterized protein TREMEDRAFT_73615 [Tremella mesenterica DSM 1558]EIW69755.1 hypothetical protein TREMEDRAFT_73615 [Tremella mesenterica DSM 1558]